MNRNCRNLIQRMADELQEFINYAPTGPCDEEQALVNEARTFLAQSKPQSMSTWTEGVCGDGAAILKDGVMQPIEDVIAALNAAEAMRSAVVGLPPRVGHILRLAEIIREVDGNHDKGAAALAEAILSHPDSRWQPREAQPGPVGPCTEQEAIEAYDSAYRKSTGIEHAGFGAVGCTEHHRAGIRAVLARYGRPAITPIPVSERLPEAGEMNDDNEVWIEEPAFDYPLGDTGDYDIEPGKWVLRRIIPFDMRNNRRWLPVNALPLPISQQNSENK
jgi:hypothetical protein